MMRVWNEKELSWTNIKISDIKDILPKGYSIVEEKQDIKDEQSE